MLKLDQVFGNPMPVRQGSRHVCRQVMAPPTSEDGKKPTVEVCETKFPRPIHRIRDAIRSLETRPLASHIQSICKYSTGCRRSLEDNSVLVTNSVPSIEEAGMLRSEWLAQFGLLKYHARVRKTDLLVMTVNMENACTTGTSLCLDICL